MKSNPKDNLTVKFDSGKFIAAVTMVADSLFEYNVDKDSVVNWVINAGEIVDGVKCDNFSVNALRKRIVPEVDIKPFTEFISQIKGTNKYISSEFRLFSPKKDKYEWYRIVGSRVKNADGSNIVAGTLVNIDSRKCKEERDLESAIRDNVTGLYYKDIAATRMSRCIANCRDWELQAVFVLNINNYNEIFEQTGRNFGDEILKNLASDIQAEFYPIDVVGRMSARRIVITMRNALNMEKIYDKALKIKRIIDRTYTGENIQNLNASIGVAVCPFDGEDFKILYEKALLAAEYVRDEKECRIEIYSSKKSALYETVRDKIVASDEHLSWTEKSSVDGDSIIQVAFRLIEEAKNADSAINMLLRRIARKMKIDVVSIIERHTDNNDDRVIYEYVSENIRDIRVSHVGKSVHSEINSKEELVRDNHEIFVFDRDNECASGITAFGYSIEAPVKSMIQCAYYKKNEYAGLVSCERYGEDKPWNKDDIAQIEIITNIIFSYMMQMRAYEIAKAQVEKFDAYDTGTGLYKYDRFKKLAQGMLNEEDCNQFVIVCTDIFNFKYVNEKYGYGAGDEVLRILANQIMLIADSAAIGTRVASDNFMILARCGHGLDDNIISKLKSMVQERSEIFSHMVSAKYGNSNVRLSTGICFFDKRETTLMEAVSYADLARKKAKKPENPDCIIYDSEMGAELKRRTSYLSDINQAFLNREFVVYLQPKVDARTEKIVGAEALVRWKRSDGRIIYPSEFISLLEENRLICDLDYYVYDEVCRYTQDRIRKGEDTFPISVNASRMHLQYNDRLKQNLEKVVRQYGVPADCIEVELTENMFIDDVTNTVSIINSIREMGIQVSMDDFGSGYSSLNMLKKLPIDVIKLDKAFIDDVDTVQGDVVISSAIDMAKKLGLKVVCEGVETKEQVGMLKAAGCDIIQGYYYSKPISMESFDKLYDRVNGQKNVASMSEHLL